MINNFKGKIKICTFFSLSWLKIISNSQSFPLFNFKECFSLFFLVGYKCHLPILFIFFAFPLLFLFLRFPPLQTKLPFPAFSLWFEVPLSPSLPSTLKDPPTISPTSKYFTFSSSKFFFFWFLGVWSSLCFPFSFYHSLSFFFWVAHLRPQAKQLSKASSTCKLLIWKFAKAAFFVLGFCWDCVIWALHWLSIYAYCVFAGYKGSSSFIASVFAQGRRSRGLVFLLFFF